MAVARRAQAVTIGSVDSDAITALAIATNDTSGTSPRSSPVWSGSADAATLLARSGYQTL
jgi:hypothetical protein